MSKTGLMLAGSLACLSLATPALAAPGMADGFVAIDGGASKLVLNDPSSPYSVTDINFGGAAAVEFNFTPNLGAQGDFTVKWQNLSNDQIANDVGTDLAAEASGHIFYRDSHLLLGVFGQAGRDSFGFRGEDGQYDVDNVLGGAEGQVFLGNATLYAQGGVTHFTDTEEYEDGLFGTLAARYFLQPDFEIEAHGGVETMSNSGSNKGFYGFNTTLTTLSAGLTAEYHVANTPVSLFASYDHYHTTAAGGGDSLDNDRILFGAKFNFDDETLLDRDRTGASLKPFDSHGLDLLSPL